MKRILLILFVITQKYSILIDITNIISRKLVASDNKHQDKLQLIEKLIYRILVKILLFW